MDKLERAHRLLRERRTPVALSYLCEVLECEARTVTRLISDMRLYLNAPILNKPRQGYFYAKNENFELPGVWFSPEELHALLTIQQVTANLSGEPTAIAVLRFSEHAARWVRDEEWFPEQESCELEDGGLELSIPYHNPTELVMEICRYGPEVEVIEPVELRLQVAAALRAAVEQYR